MTFAATFDEYGTHFQLEELFVVCVLARYRIVSTHPKCQRAEHGKYQYEEAQVVYERNLFDVDSRKADETKEARLTRIRER